MKVINEKSHPNYLSTFSSDLALEVSYVYQVRRVNLLARHAWGLTKCRTRNATPTRLTVTVRPKTHQLARFPARTSWFPQVGVSQ